MSKENEIKETSKTEVSQTTKEEATKKTEEVKTSQPEQKEKKNLKTPENLKKIVKEIEEMKVIDLSKLVKVLEEKFGISSIPSTMQAPISSASGDSQAQSDKKEEKSVYDLIIASVGEKKIEVIKAIKEITQKGLKECKDLTDAVSSGAQVIKAGLKKEEAEEMKKKLETAGATAELK